MNELIKVTEKEGKQIVSARELYDNLGMDLTHWSRWSKKNIIENDFVVAHQDWEGVAIMVNGNETTDYAITIDFAKRIAMMAKTEKGELIRTYFIECERKSKVNSMIKLPSYAEALRELAQSIEVNE